MPKEKTLSDAFYETLKDVYYAEKQSVRALTKAAKAAKAAELKTVFEEHRDESAGQVERLEQVFEIFGKPARSKTCEAMQGLTQEMQEDLEDFGSTAAADAVLIGCAQASSTTRSPVTAPSRPWATQLGLDEAATLLDQTLEEEKAADGKLTQVGEQIANASAGEGEVDEEEQGDEGERKASKDAAPKSPSRTRKASSKAA